MRRHVLAATIGLAAIWPAQPATAYVPGTKGPCHAAVDTIAPAHLRSWFHEIVRRESGGNPHAVHHNRNGTIDRGCAQINSRWKFSAGCLFDPRCNMRAALHILHVQGRSAWAVR